MDTRISIHLRVLSRLFNKDSKVGSTETRIRVCPSFRYVLTCERLTPPVWGVRVSYREGLSDPLPV